MATKFLSAQAQYQAGVNLREDVEKDIDETQLTFAETEANVQTAADVALNPQGSGTSYAIQNDQDAPPCSTCGAIMIRNGACYKCVNCGATSGCA